MNEEVAFLRAIVADPKNDRPRLIYADWLQEQNDPIQIAQSEMIRLKCSFPKMDFNDPQISRYAERYNQLWNQYALDLFAKLSNRLNNIFTQSSRNGFFSYWPKSGKQASLHQQWLYTINCPYIRCKKAHRLFCSIRSGTLSGGFFEHIEFQSIPRTKQNQDTIPSPVLLSQFIQDYPVRTITFDMTNYNNYSSFAEVIHLISLDRITVRTNNLDYIVDFLSRIMYNVRISITLELLHVNPFFIESILKLEQISLIDAIYLYDPIRRTRILESIVAESNLYSLTEFYMDGPDTLSEDLAYLMCRAEWFNQIKKITLQRTKVTPLVRQILNGHFGSRVVVC